MSYLGRIKLFTLGPRGLLEGAYLKLYGNCKGCSIEYITLKVIIYAGGVCFIQFGSFRNTNAF